MLRREEQHNTSEQAAGYLREALRIVDYLDPPDDLRGIAFEKAVELLASKQIFFEQAQALMSPLAIPGGRH